MNINEILLEETYDVEFAGKIWDYAWDRLKTYSKNTQKILNITKFIPPKYNPNNMKVIFVFDKDEDAEDDVYTAMVDDTTVKIHFVSTYPFSEYSKTNYNQMKNTIKHEIVHVIDYIKGKGKTQKRREGAEVNAASYLAAPTELNAVINLFSAFRKRSPKEYNKISSYEELLRIFLKKGRSYKGFSKEALNDVSLKEKIIKRLSREGILPKNFV